MGHCYRDPAAIGGCLGPDHCTCECSTCQDPNGEVEDGEPCCWGLAHHAWDCKNHPRHRIVDACVDAIENEIAEWKAAGDQGEVGALRQAIRSIRSLSFERKDSEEK